MAADFGLDKIMKQIEYEEVQRVRCGQAVRPKQHGNGLDEDRAGRRASLKLRAG